jgi:DNA mismatch repair protein MutS2
MKENERLKKDMETLMDKEKHYQQLELLKHQNKVSEDKLAYIKDMERKLRQLVMDWKRAEGEENKKELIQQLQILLFKQGQQQSTEKVKKKLNSKYKETGAEVEVGQKVLMKKNHKVGEVKEIKGRKVIVQLGVMPITVDMADLVVVEEKES